MILLDTNALIAALGYPEKFGKKTRRIIEGAGPTYFSSISLAELHIKASRRKFNIQSLMSKLVADSGLRVLPFDQVDALQISNLSGLTRHDPFDRMILATALANRAKLITSDRLLLSFGFSWVLDSFE